MSSPQTITYSVQPCRAPQFLYRLVKLVTEESSQIIEWSDGQINIYKPDELGTILSKYYRHSNLSSFHRQLTNYGFYKNTDAGGLMCFGNDHTSKDVHSILSLKVITSNKQFQFKPRISWFTLHIFRREVC